MVKAETFPVAAPADPTIPVDESTRSRSSFSVGLFGATRAGKTVYLTTLYWLSKKGKLPARVKGLRPQDAITANYLGSRYAKIEAGQWPEGNIDSHPIAVEVDLPKKILTVSTNDFRGGDFTAAFYGDNPADNERAKKFVRDLFKGCSAYLFLIDCTDVEAAGQGGGLQQHQLVARHTGAVETALSVLRKGAWGFTAAHRPVSIVFTKCDQAAECARDPESYAQRHLRPTCDYLRKHVPRHKFFAVTSTGPVLRDQGAPPLPLQPSPNLLEPILWCEEQHAALVRWFRLSLAVVAMVVLLAGWLGLCAYNGQRLGSFEAEIPQAGDERLPKLYQQVQGWQNPSWFSVTHPRAVVEAELKVVEEATRRLEKSLAGRRGPEGHLRTTEDIVAAENEIPTFAKGFPNTEPAIRFSTWIETERGLAGRRVIGLLQEAAQAGNERRFNDLLVEYHKLASATLDGEVNKARRTLDENIALNQAKILWHSLTVEPANIGRIRETCSDAEKTLLAHPHSAKVDRLVKLTRQTYDRLGENQTAAVSFRIETSASHKVIWWYEIDGDDVAKSDEWRAPVQRPDDKLELSGASANINLVQTRVIRVAFNVNDWNYAPWAWWVSHLSARLTPRELASAENQRQEIKSGTGAKYDVVFKVDDRLVEHFKWMREIEKLGNELFRSAK